MSIDSSPEYEAVCGRMRAFVEEVHGYQKASTPLIEIGDEYFENVKYNYIIDCDELGVGEWIKI